MLDDTGDLAGPGSSLNIGWLHKIKILGPLLDRYKLVQRIIYSAHYAILFILFINFQTIPVWNNWFSVLFFVVYKGVQISHLISPCKIAVC